MQIGNVRAEDCMSRLSPSVSLIILLGLRLSIYSRIPRRQIIVSPKGLLCNPVVKA